MRAGRTLTAGGGPAARNGVRSVYFVVEPNRQQLAQVAELLDGGWPR
jgi:hypothetical protein